MSDTSDLRDQLPDDLNAEHIGAYEFPDNSRRRWPAVIYLSFAVILLAVWLLKRDDGHVLINEGYAWAAVLFVVVGAYSFSSGWRMQVDEKQALVAAQGAVGFAVGHASAQQVWRGLRSRPTWRVLVYSAENPPRQRGLVLVDAVDGSVVEHMTEVNPEDDWAE
ncbi:MAG: hypothetical protein WD023_08075 [Ilumatobacteraceae bacterium]